jgi:hypothetical protein
MSACWLARVGFCYGTRWTENRAVSVKNWLVQNAGVDPARITTQGWGETKRGER